MAAQELIKGGIKQRIGNGSNTKVWEYPWLPDETNPMIHIELDLQVSSLCVVDLINQPS